MGRNLRDGCLEWLDLWWDPMVRLVWNPPGAFRELSPSGTLHLVPPSAWYALGLLARDGPGDRERATGVLSGLCHLQYDEPGAPWHGSFARFAESPRPGPGSREWIDWDGNWRQFVGTAFALARKAFELSADLEDRLDAAIALAVAGEPADRVPEWYSNIAVLKAYLDVEFGDRAAGEAFASAITARVEAAGPDEFNSPTYYGIDLLGASLWRRASSSDSLGACGARLERALWGQIGEWYHAGLGNLCGPFTRAYGMNMHRYASVLGLWLWQVCGREQAPVPEFEGAVEHGHDVALGPVLDLVGTEVPDDALAHLVGFQGERSVERHLPACRRMTGWLSERVMIGAEDSGAWPARGQHHPATVHWRAPGGVGWIRVRSTEPVHATADPAQLSVGVPSGTVATFVVDTGGDGSELSDHRWHLPGLDVGVEAPGGSWRVERDHALVKARVSGASEIRLKISPV